MNYWLLFAVSIGFAVLFDFLGWFEEHILFEVTMAKMSNSVCTVMEVVVVCMVLRHVTSILLL